MLDRLVAREAVSPSWDPIIVGVGGRFGLELGVR